MDRRAFIKSHAVAAAAASAGIGGIPVVAQAAQPNGTGATTVSLTHFKDRDGGELSNISPRRYFCLQCHVPQTDAKPLVDNTFRSAAGLR